MEPLHKFVASREAVMAIAAGSLKFTRTDDLNDPSELLPSMDREAVRASLSELRRAGFSEVQFEWLARQAAVLNLLSPETQMVPCPETRGAANRILGSRIYDDMELMERQVLRTIELIRTRVGVLSLTERYDSLPMWAHYGAQASGYVVRFTNLAQVFDGDETGSLNHLKPVRYVESLVGLTHDPSTQDDLFFSKFLDWSYEREWRVVSALSSCRFMAGPNLYLRSIDPEHVTGVICGWKTPSAHIAELAAGLEAINPTMKIWKAALERGRVVLSEF